MKLRLIILALPCLFAGCGGQVTPRSVANALTPETVSFGLTGPNLIEGPIYNNPPRGGHNPDASRFGVIGATVSFTYRFKKLQIERAEIQPVSIVKPPPATPFPRGEWEAP